jgi:hypothetical protein
LYLGLPIESMFHTKKIGKAWVHSYDKKINAITRKISANRTPSFNHWFLLKERSLQQEIIIISLTHLYYSCTWVVLILARSDQQFTYLSF